MYCTVCTRIYIAYKSPLKIESGMWSKIIDPRISRRWFLKTCTGWKLRYKLNTGLSDCVRGPPSTASSLWVTDVKAGHSPCGGGGGRWRRRDSGPLMRNWDHGISRIERDASKLRYSDSERREGDRRAAFPRKMRDIIVVGDLKMCHFISDDTSGSHPANTVFNQVHQWTDGCEPMVPWQYPRLQRC